MEKLRRAVWLAIWLSLLSVATPRISAQNPTIQAKTATSPHSFHTLETFEKRLQLIDEELSLIKKQMNGQLTTESQSALLNRVQRVENELRQLKGEIGSVKEHHLDLFASRGKTIQSQLAMNFTSHHGQQLSQGENSFCIDFISALDNSPADPGEVSVEATLDVGPAKLMRALVRLSRPDVSRYCAQVDFPRPGVWSIVVKYKGASGKGKAAFLARIN